MKIVIRKSIEALRQPDRLPRCYEMTEQERLKKIQIINSKNDSLKKLDPNDEYRSHNYHGA